jgi:undecaprenyl diphosphate synthase
VASIQCCTLFAFSTDNWSRPYQEVAGLLQLLQQMAIHYSNHDIASREGRMRIQILGDMEDKRIPISRRRELQHLSSEKVKFLMMHEVGQVGN